MTLIDNSADPARSGKPARSQEPAHQHRDVSGGWLRPTVFGAMDGLVTNVSLIAGVGGGGLDRQRIILTGLAGLVAGAFSMATGEYTSVASQNELVRAEVELERRELHRNPEREQRELAEAFVDKGVDPELAHQVARQVSEDPDEALLLHAREELGVDPTELPSPWVAAVSSFFSFSIGAVVPLLPFFAGVSVLWPALAISAVTLFGAGAVVARLTNKPIWFGGLRQLALAVLAAGVTYGVGRGIGASVG
ncbi:MAG TPA: VIT1/CCC1 transporter family protein [Mycobacteriales bacterium]|nr:VIT1/CCC1 transporter family protein [Mycobacteriales bacterium]